MSDNEFDDNQGDMEESRGRGRGRGGRGRGGFDRGGRGGFERGRGRGSRNGDGDHRNSDGYRGDRFRDNDDGERNGGENGEDEKPKERYIPPEPSDDQNDIFGGGISKGINFDNYDKIEVKVSGVDKVNPINTFEDCNLREVVAANLKQSGYIRPTPIQKHAFPSILAGRDLMACAQTGSGKTAAFLVPIINSLLANQSELIINDDSIEPQAVILSPVRELSIQIFSEARKFAYSSILKCVNVYGGTVPSQQLSKMMKGCNILVGTPGRIIDFVNRGRISFSSVRYFVLDEADRMLDMGFLPEVEKMLQHPTMTPVGERQTLMFSATFPEEIQRLAAKYLNNYLFIAVGIVGGACPDVEQVIYEVPKCDKQKKLVEILNQVKGEKDHLALVFVERKRTADFIAAFLSENQFPATSIHGDRLQSQREMALGDFKTGNRPIMVATALGARGLDIPNVTHVINFDLPKSIDEYVHKIGRTGRVGNKGKATSFFDPEYDGQICDELKKILHQCGQEIPSFLESFGGGGSHYGGGGHGGQSFGARDARKGNDDDFGSRSAPAPAPAAGDCDDEGW